MKHGAYFIIGLLIVALKGFAQDGASNLEFVENKGHAFNSRLTFRTGGYSWKRPGSGSCYTIRMTWLR